MKKLFYFILALIIISFISFIILSKLNTTNKISNEIGESPSSETNIITNSNKISVEYNVNETWQQDGKTASLYNVKLKNISEADIENWNIIFGLNNPVKISQFWNCKLETKENYLNVNPEDYNNTIQKENEIEIGFILLSNDEAPINSYKLNINGEEYIEPQINEEKTELAPPPKIESNLETTPLNLHGKLSVNGTNIVDKNGDTFIIQGVSTHGIAWFPQYVSLDTFKTLRDDFNANTIRIAMYSDKNSGYSTKLHELVSKGVDYATELGMYVIIDWHILSDNNPNQNKNNAIVFFKEMANKYKNNENVLYEICNEPNGNVTWDSDIKPYAEELISTIRNIDNDAIIIVGTPNWSQDVDIASKNPITNQNNLVYSLHFYASTHKEDLRNKLKIAINNNLPILVSEFGISDASGNGTIDTDEGNTWINYLRNNGIGYVCWNLSNKDETSSILKSTTNNISNWTNEQLSNQGLWLKNIYNK